jgi:hypothetical protein
MEGWLKIFVLLYVFDNDTYQKHKEERLLF